MLKNSSEEFPFSSVHSILLPYSHFRQKYRRKQAISRSPNRLLGLSTVVIIKTVASVTVRSQVGLDVI